MKEKADQRWNRLYSKVLRVSLSVVSQNCCKTQVEESPQKIARQGPVENAQKRHGEGAARPEGSVGAPFVAKRREGAVLGSVSGHDFK